MARPRRSNFHLPKYVTIIHGAYWYKPTGQKAVRLGRVSEYSDAMDRYRALSGSGFTMDPKLVPRLLGNVVKNAKPRKLSVEITAADVMALWERSRGHCEVTGIQFESVKLSRHHKRPWMPSIDRIDRRRGYTPDNVRLVCAAANYAMNEWGEEVLARLATAYLSPKNHRRFQQLFIPGSKEGAA